MRLDLPPHRSHQCPSLIIYPEGNVFQSYDIHICVGEASVGKLEDEKAGKPGGGGEFRCTAAYPSAEKSLRLGRQNLHLFRLKNTRFDFIGGGIYFLIVVCTSVSKAESVMQAICEIDEGLNLKISS